MILDKIYLIINIFVLICDALLIMQHFCFYQKNLAMKNWEGGHSLLTETRIGQL